MYAFSSDRRSTEEDEEAYGSAKEVTEDVAEQMDEVSECVKIEPCRRDDLVDLLEEHERYDGAGDEVREPIGSKDLGRS